MAESEPEVEKKDFKTTDSSRGRPKCLGAECGQVPETETEETDNKTSEITKPDGGRGWLVCLGAFICNFVVFGTHNSFGVIYGTLIKELSISSAETAWIGSMAMGLNFFFGPIASALCERIGCRLTTLTGAVLSVSGLLLSSFITKKDVSKMYATYGVMWGVGSSMCYVPSMVILGQYFDKRMALANGLGTSGSGFGTLIMAPVIQKLLSTLGWRATFRFLSGSAALLFIAVWLFRPMAGRRVKDEETAHPCVDLNIWRNKAFIVWVLSISFFLFGYFIPFVHLVRLAHLHNVSGDKAAWLIGYLSIASTVGRVFFGKIGDMKRVNRLMMFQFSILIIGASTALLSLAKNYVGLVLYAITFGFFDGCFVGQVAVVTSSIVGMKHLGVALGYLFGSIAIPMTLGPPVAGWIFDAWQSYNVAFYVAGSTSFIGFLTMFIIPRLVKKHSETWEKQFDFKRRASIESRRKLLSSTDSAGGAPGNSYEIDVFTTTDNCDAPQIAVERPNYNRGRRRSLPALYINNNSSPSTPSPMDKPRLSPGLQKIARLSAEMSSDDRVNSTDSHLLSETSSGGNLATDKPRPYRTRARRGSMPAIAYRPGNPTQRDVKAPRVPQLLLVDASLLTQQGISLVSVNIPPKVNRNKRRGSLPAVNYPSLANPPGAPKPVQPKAYNLSKRRGSLPTVSLTIPEETHFLGNENSIGMIGKKNRLSTGLKDSIDELEEEGHQDNDGHHIRNIGSAEVRLSIASSGYDTNGCSPAENSGIELLAETKGE